MQKITPHLWFDKEAKEATEFYASIFPDSKVINTTTLHDTPSGDTSTLNPRGKPGPVGVATGDPPDDTAAPRSPAGGDWNCISAIVSAFVISI